MELEEVERLRRQYEEDGTVESLLVYEAALSVLLEEVGYELGEVESPACPVCGGPQSLIGVLGRRNHYRCRNCGLDHSDPVELKGEGSE